VGEKTGANPLPLLVRLVVGKTSNLLLIMSRLVLILTISEDVHISDRWMLDPCIGSRIFSSTGTIIGLLHNLILATSLLSYGIKGRICIVIVVARVYRPTLGVLT
jgi:hypothetical protein